MQQLGRFLTTTMVVLVWRMFQTTAMRTTTTAFPRSNARAVIPRSLVTGYQRCFHKQGVLGSSWILQPPQPGQAGYCSDASARRRFGSFLSATKETDTETDTLGPSEQFIDPQQQHSSYSVILEGLNENQVEATTQPTNAITRVIAGPGSGKTRVLTCRIAHLLQEDTRSRILAVTFTRKAAGEMQQRVEKILRAQQAVENPAPLSLSNSNDGDANGNDVIVQESDGAVPPGLDRVTLGTFHSICAKILRWNGALLAGLPLVRQDMAGSSDATNLDGGFAILDQGDQLRILKECLDAANIDLKQTGLKPQQILSAISNIKEELVKGNDPFKSNDKRKPVSKTIKVAGQIFGSYRQKLFSNNALDFDDLIFLARELLIENEELRQNLHRRWPHVLVDEFQDTSRSQMDLIKLLTSSSLFVVGDADQSIYSWRGAHVGSLADFADEFKNYMGGVHTVYLMENYRSTSNIVRAAEKVIGSSGTSSYLKDEKRQSMKPKRGSGPPPRVVACADEKAEANFVVDSILDMVVKGTVNPDHTVALIYRTNAQSRHLEEVCVRKGLNYVIRGAAGGFYKRAEIKDCLCFLRWLYNGHDQSAMLRAMKTPTKGIGDVAIKEFQEYCSEVASFYQEVCPSDKAPTPLEILISLSDGDTSAPSILAQGSPEATTFITKRALNKFLPFSRQMRSIREKAYGNPVDSLLFYIIEELDLVSHFDSISKSKAEFEERRENVQELRQATKRYSKNGSALKPSSSLPADFDNDSALSNFLDDVALVTDIKGDAEPTSGDKRLVVNLMTIHGSKGMEFDAVFVVGNEDGTFPSNRALQEGDGSVALEEEKRLCYVAMTRAKTQLIMTWRKEVTGFSAWSDDGPRTTDKTRSRFLDVLVSKKTGSKSSGKSNDDVLRTRGSSISVPSRSTSRSFSSTSFSSSNNGSTSSRNGDTNPRPASREYSSSQKPWQKKSQWNQSKESEPIHPTLPAKRASSTISRNREAVEGGMEKPTVKAVPRDTSAMQNSQRPAGINGTRQPPGIVSKIKPIVNDATISRAPPASDGQTGGNKPRPQTASKPREGPFADGSPVNHRQASAPNTRSSPPKARQAKSTEMDSTWFYPVGSQVVHQNFGRGKVLQPPPPSESKDLLVRVEFENGKQMEFPAAGTDIGPDLGF